MSDILLSISMLVSGREETTKRSLDSLRGILDSINSELILVDTGCGPKLRSELSQYTSRIVDFTWCNDFAKARNAGLKEARGQWFMFLDDDEWFEDVGPIVEFFTSGEYREYDQAVYKSRNYSNFEGTGYEDSWVSRMIRLEPDTRFEGRVHEQLLPAKGKCKKIEAFVHHYGYVFADEEEKKAHFQRNASLLEQLLTEQPNNMRWYLQLLKEYGSLKDGANMRKCALQALQMIGETDTPFVNKCRGSFCVGVLMGDYMQKDFNQLEADGKDYMQDMRLEPAALCSIYSFMVRAAFEQEEYEKAERYCREYFRFYEKYQGTDRTEQEQIIDESIIFVNSYVAREEYRQLCIFWGESLGKLGRVEEFPEDKRRELIDFCARLMDNNAKFLVLSEGLWSLAQWGVLPLEEMILQLPFSQWMALSYVLEGSGTLREWQDLRRHLSGIRTREDIRYDYFDSCEAKVLIRSISSENYEDLREALWHFADSSLRFARRVYTGKAFEGEMELLGESDRSAVWIARALACGQEDWREELECLKRAALEWSALGRIVKQFAKLLGEEQERKEKQSQEANAQLLLMAQEIKKQIGSLKENGQFNEALETVRQVRNMLPQDPELQAMEEALEADIKEAGIREGSSADRITEPVVLSIALLVSNRKDTIQKCLDSLTPIREQIPSELIIVDTGCDEELHRLLEDYADVLTTFTWVDDFAKARNESLRHATGEWFMYLDDDEWFVDSEEIIDFFKSGEYKQYGYASYIQRNFLDMEATQYSDAWVSRLIQRTPETHFESRIHEYMAPMQGNCKGLKSIVHHFGYVYETEEALWKHYERNVALLQEMIAEEPDNLRWRMQIALEYRTVKEYEKLLALGEECLALTRDRNEMYDNIALGGFYGAKIVALKEMGRYEEALAVCKEAEADSRNTHLCQTFLSLRMSELSFFLGAYGDAEKYALEYIRWKAFFDKNEPLLYLQKAVPFVAECFDDVMIKEGYSLLICSGLKQGSTVYLQKHLSDLKWNEHHLYVFEHIVQTLIEAMCTMPPEDIFAETLKVMYAHGPLWEYTCQQITAWEESGHNISGIIALIRSTIPEAIQEETSGSSADAEQFAEISQEVQQLGDQIKEQLRTLIANGYTEQAREVIAQVQDMLPGDEELLQMERQLRE